MDHANLQEPSSLDQNRPRTIEQPYSVRHPRGAKRAMSAITYRLSSLDQSASRAYLRYCLCWSLRDTCDETIEEITQKLTTSLRHALGYMPILGGVVEASVGQTYAAIASGQQRGTVKVRVASRAVEEFTPTVRVLSKTEFPFSYGTLVRRGMPAADFVADVFTALPDSPALDGEGSCPALAVQATILEGGVVVAFQLHNSVAGVHGLEALIRLMTMSAGILLARDVTLAGLQVEALVEGKLRDRLSDSRGVEANLSEHPEYDTSKADSAPPTAGTCKALSFSLHKLGFMTEIMNERYQAIHRDASVQFSVFDCITAILWKAVHRARWQANAMPAAQTSALILPINIRSTVDLDPALGDKYIGNANIFSHTIKESAKLLQPFDITTVSDVALTVRRGINSIDGAKTRSAIAIINASEDVRTLTHLDIDYQNDLHIEDWSELPVGEDSSLGLGLGPPEYARKPSKSHTGFGCVLMPMKKDQGVWEVIVQLPTEAMTNLVADSGLAPFLFSVT